MNSHMPPNPHTGLLNVTPDEVADARAAEDGVTLVRPDGTLTPAGMVYVADTRTMGHEDCSTCHPTPHEIARRAGLSPAHFVDAVNDRLAELRAIMDERTPDDDPGKPYEWNIHALTDSELAEYVAITGESL